MPTIPASRREFIGGCCNALLRHLHALPTPKKCSIYQTPVVPRECDP
jgi:hypothetical protein